MLSLTFGLTLATYASAQVVSMIPNPNLAGASGSGNGYSMSSSSDQYNQYGSSSSASYNQYSSAPAQYTPPPQSEAMPYSSFMSGGYKSMDCGYGYVKGSDGGCMSTQSWVRISHFEISRAMQFMRFDRIQYSTSGCYQMYQSSRYIALYNWSLIESSFVRFAVVTSSPR
jgi:hypothetical protein